MARAAALAALIAAALAACAPKAHESAPIAATDCNEIIRAPVLFSSPDAPDIVETRAIGDHCATAAAVLIVRKATGEPLWAWATAHPWLRQDGAGDPAAMDAFLRSWKPRVDTTAALPDWPERDVYKDSLGPFMSTPFDRDRYLEIRAKAYPRLCFATGVDSGACIYFDTGSGQAFEVLENGA
jgi:hypothetical protein